MEEAHLTDRFLFSFYDVSRFPAGIFPWRGETKPSIGLEQSLPARGLFGSRQQMNTGVRSILYACNMRSPRSPRGIVLYIWKPDFKT